MEFHIEMAGSIPDLDVIEEAIRAVDPSVLVDIDAAGQILRVSASVDAALLVSLLRQAGYPVAQDQVFQVPSICCGGCSG
ncbi:MAG: hypothetical protein ACYC42_10845 [Lysobacter sp.]